MAIIERMRKLFSLQDPTGEWQRAALLRLEADLDRPALNGVELGRSFGELRMLGPVEERDRNCRVEFRYPSLGLIVDSEDDEAFTAFQLLRTEDVSRPGFTPFSGECRSGGHVFSLADMTEARWTAMLGECYWRDQDEDEIILFYEFPTHEWQVEFAPDGSLNRVIVTLSPLMAEERVRQSYGVTRPWPPESAVGR